MKTLIKNCRLVSPGIDEPNAAIVVDGKRVAAVITGGAEFPPVENEFDATGLTAVPGFVDRHTHGAGGRDATESDPAGIGIIAEKKLREGVTTFLPTTLTLPESQLAAALGNITEYMRQQPCGAKVPGVHLEGPFINRGSAGAQNPDYVRPPDIAEIERLDAIAKVLMVSFAVEVEGGIEFAAALAERGITASCGHSAAKYADFRRARAAGVRCLTHFCNQMSALHHREIGLVGAGLLEDDVFVEVIADKIHLAPDMLRLVFKVKPPELVIMITDSVAASWLPDGEFSLGGLKVKVAGGAARLVSNGALAGSTAKFNETLRNVHELTGLPLSRLIAATSLNAANSLGLPGIGRLQPGFAADITLLDADFNVAAVFVDGACKFRSAPPKPA